MRLVLKQHSASSQLSEMKYICEFALSVFSLGNSEPLSVCVQTFVLEKVVPCSFLYLKLSFAVQSFQSFKMIRGLHP